MKKTILNLGQKLNKTEQKQINGGRPVICYNVPICPPYRDEYCFIYNNKCEIAR